MAEVMYAPLILLSIFAWISAQDFLGITLILAILWVLWDEFIR